MFGIQRSCWLGTFGGGGGSPAAVLAPAARRWRTAHLLGPGPFMVHWKGEESGRHARKVARAAPVCRAWVGEGRSAAAGTWVCAFAADVPCWSSEKI